MLFLDDDMQVRRDLLEKHLGLHGAAADRVVLGRIVPDTTGEKPLFIRFHGVVLERAAVDAQEGRFQGSNVWTGNMSVPRALFEKVGGFDAALEQSEDAELGIRLEKAGAVFVVSDEVTSIHESDHVSVEGWMARAYDYGRYEARIARKHADSPHVNPWRYLGVVNPVARPFLAASAVVPRVAGIGSRVLMRAAQTMDSLGVERLAIAGCTVVFGMEYVRGVRSESGNLRQTATAYAEYLRRRRSTIEERDGAAGASESRGGRRRRLLRAAGDLVDAVREDHRVMRHYGAKYSGRAFAESDIPRHAVEKIGFQMMIAYRVMRMFVEADVPVAPQVVSRLIRHLYGADVHWNAVLEPGVVIVHGMGMAISHAARVGRGSILFQNVTLGEATHPVTRVDGGPTLEPNVHVGAGATLLGPITVGRESKITAGALVTDSVPAGSLVQSPSPVVRSRAAVSPPSPPVNGGGRSAR